MRQTFALIVIACVLLPACATTPPVAPTVDVTGKWAGEWSSPNGGGPIMLNLQQADANVTGDLLVPGFPQFSGSVRGTVSGDSISLMVPGSGAEITVKGNEMTAYSRQGNRWILRRQ